MAKYHIREDGMPGECTAQPGNCPRGSDEDHYANKMDALIAAEEKLREEGNFLVSVKKRHIFHVGVGGAVEECPYRDGFCEVKPFDRFNNLHSGDKDVIDGAARAFREAAGDTTPSPIQAASRKSYSDYPDDALADWEQELLDEEAERARNNTFSPSAVTPPRPATPPRPKVADDPITKEAHKVRDDGYNRYRDAGWTEKDIQYYRDSCGHSLPPGRRLPGSNSTRTSYSGC